MLRRVAVALFTAALTAAVFVPGASAKAGAATTPTTTPTTTIKQPTVQPPVVKAPAPPRRLAARLWATVNVCDTPAHPDTIGVGASIPGTRNAKHELYMRFQIQYRTPVGTWKHVGLSGDSDFIKVGTGELRNIQAGHNFILQAPVKGQILVRGEVTFEWRKGTKVLMRAKRLTIGGRTRTTGADPKRFSAAACTIKPDSVAPVVP